MDTKKQIFANAKDNILFLSGNVEKLQAITTLLLSDLTVKNNKTLVGALSTSLLLLQESEAQIQKVDNFFNMAEKVVCNEWIFKFITSRHYQILSS